MAENRHITRRHALQSAAFLATPAVLAAPLAVAAAEAESPALHLYREHKALYFMPVTPGEDGPAIDAAMDRIESELLALPVRSASDLAAKVAVYMRHGDDVHGDSAFWREIVALTEAH